VTSIRITVEGRTLTARLADNATARDLVDQLPLTLRFRDFNRVEKIAKLPRPLTLDGAPATSLPSSGSPTASRSHSSKRDGPATCHRRPT
jgi:hypothetical protein